MKKLFTLLFFTGFVGFAFSQEGLYLTRDGYVHFISEAPLETIQAESNELAGVINPENNEFAFSIEIQSFQGFNSPLQQEHFNENYLESNAHPKATFLGKIIEDIDYSKIGNYEVRAKGKMTIHGEEQERIIDGTLEVTKDKLILKAEFQVLLDDHNIHIPRIVKQKISEEIDVTVNAELEKQ